MKNHPLGFQRVKVVALSVVLFLLLAGVWAVAGHRLGPTGKVSLEFAAAHAAIAQSSTQSVQEVTFIIRNTSSRAAHVVFAYAQSNGGAGWELDRSGPVGSEQDWGDVPARGNKSVCFTLAERRVPWRIRALVYEHASWSQRAEVALERVWTKLQLGSDAGRGPHLVEDRYLSGYEIVTEPAYVSSN
jgi:hypothetical protein